MERQKGNATNSSVLKWEVFVTRRHDADLQGNPRGLAARRGEPLQCCAGVRPGGPEILTETIDAKGVVNILRDWYNNRVGRTTRRRWTSLSTARR